MASAGDHDTPSLGQCFVELARDMLISPLFYAVLLGGYLVYQVYVPMFYTAKQEAAVEENLRRSPAGAFALDTMRQCLSSGPIFGPVPTNAVCINETVGAARNLRGEAFTAEVKSVLAAKYVPSP